MASSLSVQASAALTTRASPLSPSRLTTSCRSSAAASSRSDMHAARLASAFLGTGVASLASTSQSNWDTWQRRNLRKQHPRRPGSAVCVLKESQDLELGTRAPDFELPEPLSGRQWQLSDFDAHPALLVMFICNHCPYVVHIREELVKLTDEYLRKGLAVVAISSNSVLTHPQDGPEAMAKFASDCGFKFPYLYDETQEVAKAYKAACTPDFYVFKKDGRRPFELAYHGQLDDSRPKNGLPVTGRDLRAALDCVLSGRPTPAKQKPSIGCNVKWHPGNEPSYF